ASAGLALAEGPIGDESARIVVASADTDGIDGPTDAAGGIADATTLAPDAARDALDRHDVYPLLDEADALLRTGPTGTNVNDLRVMVVGTVEAE
ncbi:MAG: MOFRL family protein, partial [Halorubrum sp.]